MLRAKQQKCIALMIEGGRTQKEIAGEIRVSEATICNWKRSEEFRAAYDAALCEGVRDAAAKALRVQEQLLMAKSETVRLMAARDILDRAGVRTQDLTAVVAPVVVITGGDQLED